jgi:hypothetical protein
MIDEITDHPNVTIDETRGFIFHARFHFSRVRFFGSHPAAALKRTLNADARTDVGTADGARRTRGSLYWNARTDGRSDALTTSDDDGCAGP